MHTGIENEILATLKIIASQNNELITLVRGVIDDQVKNEEETKTVFSGLASALFETGAIGAFNDKFSDFIKEYNDKKSKKVLENATCED